MRVIAGHGNIFAIQVRRLTISAIARGIGA